MGDRTECQVSATWCNLGGSWDGPEEQRPYVVPRRGDYHLAFACPGSFESGDRGTYWERAYPKR